jgi:DNA processing protein
VNDWDRFMLSEYAERYVHPEKPVAPGLVALSEQEGYRSFSQRSHYQMEKISAFFIGYSELDYPYLLRNIPQPPSGLICKGNRALLKSECVSIVGSRNAFPSSIDVAMDLGIYFANSNISVVSGGALGCDIAAHKGCLQSKKPGQEIMVFAGGLAQTYPKANEYLHLQSLQKGGLWLSEKAPFQPCKPHHFIQRNRIIAGLSSLTILIQAMRKSGAMSTARLALDSGRDVCVLFDTRAAFDGNLKLFQDGAFAFESVDNFLNGEFMTLTQEKVWQRHPA